MFVLVITIATILVLFEFVFSKKEVWQTRVERVVDEVETDHVFGDAHPYKAVWVDGVRFCLFPSTNPVPQIGDTVTMVARRGALTGARWFSRLA